MCNRYPDCTHAGPVHDEIAGLPRHCETVLPNSDCPYHRFGCLGCTFAYKGTGFTPALVSPINLFTADDNDVWSKYASRPPASFEIELYPINVNEPLMLALLSDMMGVYLVFDRLRRAGIVTPEWVAKSMQNAVQYFYRQTICRLIATRIQQQIRAAMFEEIVKAFGIPESFFNDDQGV